MSKTFEQARREEIRWRVLRAMDAGRPLPVAETLLFRVLFDVSLSLTAQELRRELDYLEKSGMVMLKRESVWLAELTEKGIECVEYAADCPAGVARPPEV